MQCTALFWCQLLGHYPAKYRVMVPAIPGPYLGLAGQCRHGFPPRTCLLRRGSVGAPGVPAARQRCAIPLIRPSCRKATRGAVIVSRPSNKAILLGDAWLSAPTPLYLLPAQCQCHQGSQLAVPSGRWLAAPYLTLRAAMTAGSSVLATPNEVSRLTALLISPLERWDRATFLWISFFSVSLFSFPLPFLLLFLSSSLTLFTMRWWSTVPQSSSMAALNLPAT